ncbi:hypothetical protein JCM6882_001540 [Rhodosporidiobolus microsporus]
MVVHSLYIYDRHCTCCFYSDLGALPNRDPGPSTLPAVLAPSPTASSSTSHTAPTSTALAHAHDFADDRPYGVPDAAVRSDAGQAAGADSGKGKGRLAFDEEAKLVYGVVFSLRNMVNKLSSRGDESFHSFSTSHYKLHYLHTPTSFHFVLVTSPMNASLRPLLRQLYTGPFADHVVRNPLASLDTQKGGKGVDNPAFRSAVEKLLAAV